MKRQLTGSDYEDLRRRGLPPAEVDRQCQLLAAPQRGVTLDRPCTADDGIRIIPEQALDTLAALHQQAAEAGRWLKFVPASGAASRMFALPDEDSLVRLCERLSELAFYDELRDRCPELSALLQRKAYREVASQILDDTGLGYASLPKGLLKFHRYSNAARTPFEEHLYEAARCFRHRDGRCQLHFTVLPDHQRLFEQLLAGRRGAIEAQLDARLQISFSIQKASTATLALDDRGEPWRSAEGEIVLRPGGHGALLENLAELQADLVFVKNIDNVCHERLQGAGETWIRGLCAALVGLEREIHRHLEALQSERPGAIKQADDFVRDRFPGQASVAAEPPDSDRQRVRLYELLHRPLRVCGMVRNEGEPGGGPFWVRRQDGSTSLQIVESAEIDADDAAQQEIFARATHFNPVFMALALRDHRQLPFELRDFVDSDRFILARKVEQARTVRVLERPGLWNGGMAGWLTVFVEVPGQVFSPVKTVFDLLRDEHREAPAGAD